MPNSQNQSQLRQSITEQNNTEQKSIISNYEQDLKNNVMKLRVYQQSQAQQLYQNVSDNHNVKNLKLQSQNFSRDSNNSKIAQSLTNSSPNNVKSNPAEKSHDKKQKFLEKILMQDQKMQQDIIAPNKHIKSNANQVINQSNVSDKNKLFSKLQTLKNKALKIILKEGRDSSRGIHDQESQDIEKLIKEIDAHTSTFLTHTNYMATNNKTTSKISEIQNFDVKPQQTYTSDTNISNDQLSGMSKIQQNLDSLANFINFDIKDIRQLQVVLQKLKNDLKVRQQRQKEQDLLEIQTKKDILKKKDYVEMAPKLQEYVSENTNFFVNRKNQVQSIYKKIRRSGTKNSTLDEYKIDNNFGTYYQSFQNQQSRDVQSQNFRQNSQLPISEQYQSLKEHEHLNSLQDENLYKNNKFSLKLNEDTERLNSVMNEFLNDSSLHQKRAITPRSLDSRPKSGNQQQQLRKYLQNRVVQNKHLIQQQYEAKQNQKIIQSMRQSVYQQSPYSQLQDSLTRASNIQLNNQLLSSKYSYSNSTQNKTDAQNTINFTNNQVSQIQYKAYEDHEKSAKYFMNTETYLNTLNSSKTYSQEDSSKRIMSKNQINTDFENSIVNEIDPKFNQLKIVTNSKSMIKNQQSSNSQVNKFLISQNQRIDKHKEISQFSNQKVNSNIQTTNSRSLAEIQRSAANLILDSHSSPQNLISRTSSKLSLHNKINKNLKIFKNQPNSLVNQANNGVTEWSQIKTSHDSIKFMIDIDKKPNNKSLSKGHSKSNSTKIIVN